MVTKSIYLIILKAIGMYAEYFCNFVKILHAKRKLFELAKLSANGSRMSDTELYLSLQRQYQRLEHARFSHMNFALEQHDIARELEVLKNDLPRVYNEVKFHHVLKQYIADIQRLDTHNTCLYECNVPDAMIFIDNLEKPIDVIINKYIYYILLIMHGPELVKTYLLKRFQDVYENDLLYYQTGRVFRIIKSPQRLIERDVISCEFPI